MAAMSTEAFNVSLCSLKKLSFTGILANVSLDPFSNCPELEEISIDLRPTSINLIRALADNRRLKKDHSGGRIEHVCWVESRCFG